jgi:transposase
MQGKITPERSAEERVYVGIDVCKAWLDVHLHPAGRQWRLANNRDGIRRLIRQLSGYRVARIVMEATAKYHRQAHRMLTAAGLAVAVVNPLRARLFAEASGQLAKTDRLDARLLAILGQSLAPEARPPVPQTLEALKELVRARQAATAEATALTNRLAASETAFLRAELKRRIKSVGTHIARLDAEIARRLESDPALKRRHDVLMSVPGIGRITAITLIVEMSELGVCSAKAASLLAGLAPLACDSGDKSGERRIRGGRAPLRRALYMAAVAAIRCNPDLAAFYKRLRAAGKKAKVALTAVMRKIVVLANTLLQQNRLWQLRPPIHA